MLHKITMQGVGPSESMTIELAPRLNLIAGDNGLGKSFILDVAWWVLTRTWAGEPIRPPRPRIKIVRTANGELKRILPGKLPVPRVSFEMDVSRGKRTAYESVFDRTSQEWKREGGRPPIPGLILYARVDGGFCVWDPARNYWKDAPSLGFSDAARPAAFLFDTHSIWNGLKAADGAVLCKGLLVDWVEWQTTKDPAFEQLKQVLKHLSPGEHDVGLTPGTPTRVSLNDVREMPTLAMPYGNVPIQQASAAMRRVAALAYLLVWSFREHEKAQAFLGKKTEARIIFLIDEIEAHLHPRWQRAILPAMLDVTSTLAPRAKVQIIATTHSPFVPLSVETQVDEAHDALWDLDLVAQKVELNRRRWERRGDIAGWATSNLFDLKTTRSIEGEELISDLQTLYRRSQTEGETLTTQELSKMEQRLRETLPELDPIFARWGAFKEHQLSQRAPKKR